MFLIILITAVYFRFAGIYWGEEQYLHPDERFLVWVGSDISPVQSWQEYFDTTTSSLNPHNRGHGFFVYGTLPMFIARYLVEWIYGHSGFKEMTLVGRPLSALADLGTMILVYLVAKRLYRKRIAILAMAFYACAVLPIQLSHFYKEDTFTNFFIFLTLFFSIKIFTTPKKYFDANGENPEDDHLSGRANSSSLINNRSSNEGSLWIISRYTSHPLFWLSIGSGLALGCAVASKLTAVPVAMMLPAAFVLREFMDPKKSSNSDNPQRRYIEVLIFIAIAAITSILVFRIAQPYAFSGPGFLGLKPNPQWVANIQEQRTQSTGDVDFPPALQWARRSKLFSFQNLVVWGLGLPLGILSWLGFAWIGYRILRGAWQSHALLWGWSTFYFLWQSSLHNPTMRYQLPIYPTLAIFASWFVFALFDFKKHNIQVKQVPSQHDTKIESRQWLNYLGIVIGSTVLVLTFLWAFAFTRIYTRPITRVEASRWIYQNVPGPINLRISDAGEIYNQPLPYQDNSVINPALPFNIVFQAKVDGLLEAIYFPHIIDNYAFTEEKSLEILLKTTDGGGEIGRAELSSDFIPTSDDRGDPFEVKFNPPIILQESKSYQLIILLQEGNGELFLRGSAPANESSWDDGLPLRMDGYDGYGGIYQRDLIFEMYWEDNTEKLLRFINTMEQSDYLFISSNRQWGTTTRVGERYPLTSAFYRYLLGCPSDKAIIWCYNVAQVGIFKGELGFELIQVFDSLPNIGSIKINDQFAEEAFTVYDHPKVFVFKKTEQFDTRKVSDKLGLVDLTKVIHVTPRQATQYPGNLMLPEERWEEQREGGTWSELFNSNHWINHHQVLGVIAWYLSITLLGLVVFPLVRNVLSGLTDKGFPFVRIVGLLLVSYLVWLAGSFRIPFNRMTIYTAIGLLVLVNVIIFCKQRDQIIQDWQAQKKYYLMVEVFFILFFIFDLLIRFGNPDLWHPWKGGEKPMDFTYFNAVLKSTTFPPYDPWYAGGYLNYYYYGFVLLGVPVKLLGIVPSFAYNLIIPTVFSMIALGAFSLGWNLISKNDLEKVKNSFVNIRLFAGLSGALGMAVLGNLGIVRMLIDGYQKLAAPAGSTTSAGISTKMVWTLLGFFKVLSGSPLPYSIGDWYWNPSRVIPAPNEVEPITEFPFFTVLYADPHAHLFALPLALLVLAFALSIISSWKGWSSVGVVSLSFGGLAIGVLRLTNTWDFYTYLGLGCVAVGYAVWKTQSIRTKAKSRNVVRVLSVLIGILSLIAFSLLLFQPYSQWYGQGYNQIQLWKGTHTPLKAYLTHWGLYIFVVVSWMIWESIDWMASTPVSALRKLFPYKSLVYTLVGLLIIAVLALIIFLDVGVAWFVLPLASWAAILLLRPEQSKTKRFVLFLIGTSLILTLMVEIVVLRGDIARMNTVFKFYLQVWTLFAVSAAGCMGWLLIAISKWTRIWRRVWLVCFILLVGSASLYPIFAGIAKIKDRMVDQVPATLDGMLYMKYALYSDSWGEMVLFQDYDAIRWMQENIVGSPVIVEANLRDLYRWGSRYSIYTGLPGVVGWEWHQQQQRALIPSYWISERIEEIDEFYTTTDFQSAFNFLKKYQVRYIVVGQQERGRYPSIGLEKFENANGILWNKVYHQNSTAIYEVIYTDDI